MTAPKQSPADVLTTPTTTTPADDQPPAPPDVDEDQGDVDDQLARGRVVAFVFSDPVTGDRLDGIGVAIDVPEDGSAVCVAPIQTSSYLFVPAEGVQVVELDG